MATKCAATNLRGYKSNRVFKGVRIISGDSAVKAVDRAKRLQLRAKLKRSI